MLSSLLHKPFLGIDIGSSSVKLALLKSSKRGHELLNFGMAPLPLDAIVDGEVENPGAITDVIKNLIKAEKVPSSIKGCVFSVSGQSVIIKKITVPLMSEDDLAESIQQEAEQYIPFDIDEVNVDFQIVKCEGPIPKKGEKPAENEDRQMDVLLVAVKKEIIAQQSEILQNAGLKPSVVDLDVFAIENAFEMSYGLDVDDTAALVNIGAAVTNVNIIENGITAYTRDILAGGNKITEFVQKKMSVGFKDADKYKLGVLDEGMRRENVIPHVKAGLAELCEELRKTFEMYQRTSEGRVRRVHLSGGSAMIEGVETIVGQEIGLACDVVNPFRNIKFNPKVFDPEYIEKIAPMAVVAVGLAMRRLDDKTLP
ncbi:MAG: type IV pilus assembly protein PilM [Nitrospinae bacterium]|nr:type IV pilus assembly protein PilM [Nitrospinota bacterium]